MGEISEAIKGGDSGKKGNEEENKKEMGERGVAKG